MKILFWSHALVLLLLSAAVQAQSVFTKKTVLMGSIFEFTVVALDSLEAHGHFAAVITEMDRIENLISEWRPHTQISQVNAQAGKTPVKVDREVWELTHRALAYARQSAGAFDISIAALDKLWRFDGSMTKIPTEDEITQSIARVGWQYIVLDSAASTIYLEREGMKIGFGSIGKGYAADRGRKLLQQRGVTAGIVNASGDMSTWGSPPEHFAWRVGIYNPFRPAQMAQVIDLVDGAVATSGNYEKYAEIGGKRYAHIINPTTGYPSTGLTSVTVYGPSAEVANALSTSVMVLGKKAGIRLLRRFAQYRYVLISDRGKVLRR